MPSQELKTGLWRLRVGEDAEDEFRQVETRFRGAEAEFRNEGTSLRILRWDCGISLIQFHCSFGLVYGFSYAQFFCAFGLG